MLVRDAIVRNLDDQSTGPDFDFDGHVGWLYNHVESTVEEWALAHNYKFNEDQLIWEKSDA